MRRLVAYAVLLVLAAVLWACDGGAPEGGGDGTGSGPGVSAGGGW